MSRVIMQFTNIPTEASFGSREKILNNYARMHKFDIQILLDSIETESFFLSHISSRVCLVFT